MALGYAFSCFDTTQIKPDDTVAWLNRGLVLEEMEEDEQANILAAEYQLQLPDEEKLASQIEEARKAIEEKR